MSEAQLNYRLIENAARTAANSVGFLVPHLYQGMRLLDCGCGPGSITIDIAEEVAPGEVTGVDQSDYAFEMARKAAEERGVGNVRFEQGDIYNLPYETGSFDGVLTSSVMQWLDTPRKALREIFRVLRPGGVYASRDRDRRGDFFGNSNRLVRRGLTLHYWQNELLSGGDLSFGGKLRAMLLRAGFETVETLASYENHSGTGPNGAPFIAGNYDRALRNDVRPVAVKTIKENGWSNDEEMALILDAWQLWANDPRSFYCICRVENDAWKPK